MKAYLQKFMATAILGLALSSISIPAWAGAESAPEVEIGIFNNGFYFASGSMAGARYSSDSQQYIGCYLLGHSDFITCWARDKTGKSLVCASNDPGWRSMVKAITDFSHIFFTARDSICDSGGVTNESIYLK
jgi:hypothetical protein